MPNKAFWRDAWLPALLFVVGAIELATLQPTRWGVGIALEGLASVLLVFRRRHPFLLPTLATLALLTSPWIGPSLQDPSTPIAYWALSIFTLGRHLADLRGLVGLALILAMAAVQVYTEPGRDATGRRWCSSRCSPLRLTSWGGWSGSSPSKGSSCESSRNWCGAEQSAPSGTALPASYTTLLRTR